MDAVLRYQSANGRWGVGANAGLTGSSTCYGGEWVVSKWKRVTGSVWGRYNEPRYGLEIDLAAIRLVYGDMGGRLDIRRHFGRRLRLAEGMVTDGEMNEVSVSHCLFPERSGRSAGLSVFVCRIFRL